MRKQPLVNATPDAADFEQLLDDNQWTQAATFAQDDRYAGPSERIGRYYRQRLDELDSAGLEQRHLERTTTTSPLRQSIPREGWAAGLPCRPLLGPIGDITDPPSATPLASSALDILSQQQKELEAKRAVPYVGTERNLHITNPGTLQQRMAKFVSAGINPDSLAPFNDTWMEHAMEQVPVELHGVTPERVDDMVDEMHGEIQSVYSESVKVCGSC